MEFAVGIMVRYEVDRFITHETNAVIQYHMLASFFCELGQQRIEQESLRGRERRGGRRDERERMGLTGGGRGGGG